jgi:hypothetical protein
MTRTSDSNNCMEPGTSELVCEVMQEQEGGFVAECLSKAIVTQADTWQELRANVLEAVSAFFFDGIAPKRIRLHFVREEVINLA